MNKKSYLSPQFCLMEINCRTDVLSTSPKGWQDGNDFGGGDVQTMEVRL